MLSILKRQFQNFLPVMASGIMCILIISKSAVASEGIINGLKICANVIIPSLFPFMVFSSFVVKSGTYTKIGKIFSKPTKLFFNLPSSASGAVIMGFIGGYPIGVSITTELFQLGVIDKKQAARMTSFCVNAGPAFIISAVGGTIYQNENVGYLLFTSVILSSLTVGIITGIFSRIRGEKVTEKTPIQNGEKISTAFVSAAESASRGILSICVWVVTFSAVIGFIKSLGLTDEINILLCGVLEVTSGCTMSAGVFSISVTAFFISFSGFCIFFQLMPNLKKIGVNLPLFLLSRLACAILSFAYCEALMKFFPDCIQVFSNGITPLVQNFSVSIPATICLIATCVVLIFDVDRKKKMC